MTCTFFTKAGGKHRHAVNFVPRANSNLVTVPPESDNLVIQVDIWGVGGNWPAKWATHARTSCAAVLAQDASLQLQHRSKQSIFQTYDTDLPPTDSVGVNPIVRLLEVHMFQYTCFMKQPPFPLET